MAYIQNNSPFLKVRKTTKGKGRNFLSTEEGAGMTEAGVKKYKMAAVVPTWTPSLQQDSPTGDVYFVGEYGHRLEFNAEGIAVCPESKQEFKLENNTVTRIK